MIFPSGKMNGQGKRCKCPAILANDIGGAKTSIAGVVVFLLGIGITLFVVANPMNIPIFEKVTGALVPSAADRGNSSAEKGKDEVLYWYAPMDETEIYDQPGLSKMGMKLLPKYADEAKESSDSAIRIDPATVQNIGVLTEKVERGDMKVEVRTVGNLDYDEKNIYLINTKYDGWIEKVYVNYIGEKIGKGDHLFEIYSPDLVSTQEEYLSAVKYLEKMSGSGFEEAEARARSLLAASRKRLLYWDISGEQIDRLEQTGHITRTLPVVSPVSGVVINKMDKALEGMYAKAGMNLYKIADLSSLWVHIDLYEYQLPWITEGQQAEVEISFYPGEIFQGNVLFFYPFLDEKTRTMRACVEIPNPDGRLRPEMFATVRFTPVAAKDAVLVPEIAVLHTGDRDVVVVALGEGRFEPRDVQLGLQGGGNYQVLEGLEGGEEIVTSSQFLIDSESNLQEAIRKMLMAKKDEESETDMAHEESATKDMAHGSTTKPIDNGSASKEMDHAGSATNKVIEDLATINALNTVLEAYLPIWKALASDSIDGLNERIENLAMVANTALENVQDKELKMQIESVKAAASKMETGSLKTARESMKPLNRALIAIFESHNVKMEKLYYIINCPMVKENWIQDTGNVMNPFYGASMLKCGMKIGEIK